MLLLAAAFAAAQTANFAHCDKCTQSCPLQVTTSGWSQFAVHQLDMSWGFDSESGESFWSSFDQLRATVVTLPGIDYDNRIQSIQWLPDSQLLITSVSFSDSSTLIFQIFIYSNDNSSIFLGYEWQVSSISWTPYPVSFMSVCAI
jgi:hypothetical protein